MKTAKDGRIELLRFMAAIFIMIGHMASIGCDFDRPFRDTWFYVEFFLMLTGYLTAKHFAGSAPADGASGAVRSSIRYTAKKFARMLPFTTGAILLVYIINSLPVLRDYGRYAFIGCFENMPGEMLYLSAATQDGALLSPIWFISSMFIVFPLFCLLLQIRNKPLVIWLCALVSAFYYQFKTDFGAHTVPNHLMRVMCGMLAGVVVYYLAAYLADKKLGTAMRILITAAEVCAVIFPILASVNNHWMGKIFLICFFVSFVLIFSKQSYIPGLSGRIPDLLGSLAMPMYIWHTAIGYIINAYFPSLSDTGKCIIFFGGTLAVSLLNLGAVKLVRNILQKKKASRMPA